MEFHFTVPVPKRLINVFVRMCRKSLLSDARAFSGPADRLLHRDSMVVIKAVRTIRNNWKKSVVLFALSCYGAKYLHTRLKISDMMRAYCEEALRHGEEPLGAFSPARHITVLLNPVAKGRKSKQLYEQYVAPIFHSAGLKVSLVQTEAEGEAKNLMTVMDNTDAVVIVGGSGTLHEAITGLLRREDADSVSQSLPIGIVPISKYNLNQSTIFDTASVVREHGKSLGEAKILADAAMSVVKCNIQPLDVIQVNAKDRGKTVYAFDRLQLGSLHQLVSKIHSYWYLGEWLKPHFTMLKGTLFKKASSFVSPYAVELSYTDPCTGCSNCFNRLPVKSVEVAPPKRWWQAFLPRKVDGREMAPLENPAIDYSKIVNENCGVWKQFIADQIVNIEIRNNNRQSVSLTVHPASVATKRNLINEGLLMYKNESSESEQVRTVEAQDVRIHLKQELKTDESESVAEEGKEVTSESNSGWLTIDSQTYEADNVQLVLLPQRIKVYR